jgi:hypothetical protein
LLLELRPWPLLPELRDLLEPLELRELPELRERPELRELPELRDLLLLVDAGSPPLELWERRRLRDPPERRSVRCFTSPSLIVPRQPSSASSSSSTTALKRWRSALTARLANRMPRAIFSSMPWGSMSTSTWTLVRRSASS